MLEVKKTREVTYGGREERPEVGLSLRGHWGRGLAGGRRLALGTCKKRR